MIESKNVKSSQKQRDYGKFIGNALSLFNEGKIHGALYQSHNNEDRTMFPNMQHNPGMTFLDPNKKCMVGVLIGKSCSRESSTLLLNVIRDHVEAHLLHLPLQIPTFEENDDKMSLKELYKTSSELLDYLEKEKDHCRSQLKMYTEKMTRLAALSEDASRVLKQETVKRGHQFFFSLKTKKTSSVSTSSSSSVLFFEVDTSKSFLH